jgi:hypothetical protein
MKNLGILNCLLVSTLSISLMACANMGTPSQIAEKADTDALLAYAAIASSVNTYEKTPGLSVVQIASAESLKVQGWDALKIERNAYALGQAIDLTTLTNLATKAKALLGGK